MLTAFIYTNAHAPRLHSTPLSHIFVFKRRPQVGDVAYSAYGSLGAYKLAVDFAAPDSGGLEQQGGPDVPELRVQVGGRACLSVHGGVARMHGACGRAVRGWLVAAPPRLNRECRGS